MESSGEDPSEHVSLRELLNVVKSQGASITALQTQVSQDLNELKQEVHGSATQVKKLKSDTLVKWRSEGNRIQYTFNSEVSEELEQVNWAIDNGKLEYT